MCTARYAPFFFGLAALLLEAGCAASSPAAEPPAVHAGSAPTAQQFTEARATYVRQRFVRGLTQAQIGNTQEAIRLYEEALRAAPEEPALLSALAEAQQAEGDHTAALFYARQARRSAPENVSYYEQVARLLRASGELKQAAQSYEQLLNRFPGDHEARLHLARLQTALGRYDAALASYEMLIQRAGDSPAVRVQMLSLYRQTSDEAGLERTLKALVQLEPGEPLFRRSLGALYQEQGRTEEAARLLRALLRQNPEDVETAVVLAEIYRAQGRPDAADALMERSLPGEATAVQLVARAAPLLEGGPAGPEQAQTAARLLQQALEQDAENADALRMLGELRFSEGAYADAAPLLERSLEQQPRDPERWLRAAAAYLRDSQPARAADVADEGLLLFPGRLPLLRVAAYGRLEAYENDAALQRFQEALRLLDEDAAGGDAPDGGPPGEVQRADFYAALGLLHSRKKNHAASDRAYEQALDADPAHASALNNYAYSLAERGAKLDRALALARRAVRLAPGTAAYLDTLGWVHFKREDYEQARQRLDEALATGQASASVYEHRGDLAAEQGDEQTARRFWQQALERRPENAALKAKLEQP